MSDEAIRWRATKGKDGNLQWEGVKPYNKDEALSKFKPEQMGLRYGQATPRHQDLSLTPDENAMLSDVNDHISKHIHDWHNQCAGQIGKDLNQIGEEITSFPRIKGGFGLEELNARTEYANNNKRLLEVADQAQRDLNVFRGTHKGLPMLASYPDSNVLHLGIVFIFLVLEAIANAYFFSDNALGLIGGFFEAVMISGTNVFFSFVAGWFCLRQINHKSMTRKLVGLVGLLPILVFLVFLHLAAAHYREALQRNSEVDFFTSLSFNPSTLQDMPSFVLIGIGVIISIVAMYKGYKFDDPYPGYGHFYRKSKKSKEAVSEARTNYENKVNTAYTNAVMDVNDISSKLDSQKKILKGFEVDKSTYFACVDSYYGQAKGAVSALITAFRGGVETAWGAPGSFPVTPDLIKLHPIDPSQLKNEVEVRLNQLLSAKDASIKDYAENREDWIEQLETDRKDRIAKLDKDVIKVIEEIDEETKKNEAKVTQHSQQDSLLIPVVVESR